MTLITADTSATTTATAMSCRPASVIFVELLALLLVTPSPPLVAVLLVLFLIVLILILFLLIFILVSHKDTTSVADDDLPTAVGEVVPGRGEVSQVRSRSLVEG